MTTHYSFLLDCLPPSVNHIWRTTWRSGRPLFYKEKKAVEFEKTAGTQLKKLKTPITGELELDAVFTFKSAKRYAQRDLDNCLKLLLDALATNGIIVNDNQIVKIICQKKAGEADGVIGSLSSI